MGVFKGTERRCCECGASLETGRADYESHGRYYCARCRPLSEVKDAWKPMIGSSVRSIYVYKSSFDDPFHKPRVETPEEESAENEAPERSRRVLK